MALISMLYKIIEQIGSLSADEKYIIRQKQPKPLWEALFEWFHTLERSISRSLEEAVLYELNQEKYQKIDNSTAERSRTSPSVAATDCFKKFQKSRG